MTFMTIGKKIGFAAIFLAFVFGLPVMADIDEAKKKAITKNLKTMIPQLESSSIEPSPVPGVYEVIVGPDVLYITQDGRYLIRGSIIDLEAQENLTAPRLAIAAAAAIEAVGAENMVVYEPEKTLHTVTVFTDIDCGYCRKLHAEMDQYLEYGIRIRYLFFPRAGLDSASFDKAVAVWCADDRNEAMTLSKSGQDVELKECTNPVKDHFLLGKQMNIRGTPAMVLSDGEVLPGYVTPNRLNDFLSNR